MKKWSPSPSSPKKKTRNNAPCSWYLSHQPHVFFCSCSSSILIETVTIQTKPGKAITFHVELARTEAERARGLMYREKLASDHGMLFIFSEETQDPFWMKNTPISLDLIFLNQEGVIVDIIEKAAPFSEDLLMSKASYFYVLEVVAGTVQRRAIRIGDSAVRLPSHLRSSALQVPSVVVASG